MAPARHHRGRRYGYRRTPLLRALDRAASRRRQRPAVCRSRRAAADPRRSGAIILKTPADAAGRHHRIVSRARRIAMTVAIIDYGSGNLHSAAKAFERAARSMEDPQAIKVTRDPDAVYRADRIVLPGVGAFADCRRGV